MPAEGDLESNPQGTKVGSALSIQSAIENGEGIKPLSVF